MGAEISSDIQITNAQFELLQTALHFYKAHCIRSAIKCDKSYSGRVSTEIKAKQWRYTAEDCDLLEGILAEGFI